MTSQDPPSTAPAAEAPRGNSGPNEAGLDAVEKLITLIDSLCAMLLAEVAPRTGVSAWLGGLFGWMTRPVMCPLAERLGATLHGVSDGLRAALAAVRADPTGDGHVRSGADRDGAPLRVLPAAPRVAPRRGPSRMGADGVGTLPAWPDESSRAEGEAESDSVVALAPAAALASTAPLPKVARRVAARRVAFRPKLVSLRTDGRSSPAPRQAWARGCVGERSGVFFSDRTATRFRAAVSLRMFNKMACFVGIHRQSRRIARGLARTCGLPIGRGAHIERSLSGGGRRDAPARSG